MEGKKEEEKKHRVKLVLKKNPKKRMQNIGILDFK